MGVMKAGENNERLTPSCKCLWGIIFNVFPVFIVKKTTNIKIIDPFCSISGKNVGVMYITEPLIKGLSKQQNLACISSLNLSSPKDGDKKFKVSYWKYLEIKLSVK